MLTTELHNGITVLRLNHGKVNAFDLELMRRWIDEITLLERAETSAVLMTGTGSVFSAGVDLRQLIAGGREYVQEFVPLLGDMLFKTFTFNSFALIAPETFKVPVRLRVLLLVK